MDAIVTASGQVELPPHLLAKIQAIPTRVKARESALSWKPDIRRAAGILVPFAAIYLVAILLPPGLNNLTHLLLGFLGGTLFSQTAQS